MKTFIIFIAIVFFYSCNSSYQPRPKSYFQLNTPAQRVYTGFNDVAYPYSFEYATDAKLIKDSTFFEASPKNDYWINVDYANHKCKIYLSYNRINGKSVYKRKDASGKYVDSLLPTSFDKLREDAFNLTAKHIYKSTDIPNEFIRTPRGIQGVMFKVGGDAASPVQFFLTDTTTHFLRGALYYDAQPNADSTKPITDYIYKDIQHLINTLEWKGK